MIKKLFITFLSFALAGAPVAYAQSAPDFRELFKLEQYDVAVQLFFAMAADQESLNVNQLLYVGQNACSASGLEPVGLGLFRTLVTWDTLTDQQKKSVRDNIDWCEPFAIETLRQNASGPRGRNSGIGETRDNSTSSIERKFEDLRNSLPANASMALLNQIDDLESDVRAVAEYRDAVASIDFLGLNPNEAKYRANLFRLQQMDALGREELLGDIVEYTASRNSQQSDFERIPRVESETEIEPQ